MTHTHFTLRQLEIFAAVVRHGQIKDAARAVHLSEAAVSQALTALSQALGVQLFERHGRKLVATAAGRQLDALCSEPLADLQQIPELLAEKTDSTRPLAGYLRLAASTTIVRYILPRPLATLHQAHPELQIELLSGNSADVERQVANHEVDVGFIEGPNRSSRVLSTIWRTDVLQIIAPPAYPTETVALDRLAEHPWVGREAGSGTRTVFEQSLALAGYGVPEAGMVCNDTGAIVRAVAAGAGLACVTRHAARQTADAAAIQVIDFPDLSLQRPLWRIKARRNADREPGIVTRFVQELNMHLTGVA